MVRFSSLFHKGDNFCNFLFGFTYASKVPFEMGSTPEGKNLLPQRRRKITSKVEMFLTAASPVPTLLQ